MNVLIKYKFHIDLGFNQVMSRTVDRANWTLNQTGAYMDCPELQVTGIYV